MSNLRDLRAKRGMTLKQLSENIGIPIGTLGNYEQGIRTPKFKIANKIAEYFNAPIEEIFPAYQRTAPYPKHTATTNK